MGLLSSILRSANDGRLTWWCPGCDHAHQVAVGGGEGPRWGWNGSADKPTFTPSVLVRGRDFTPKGQADYDAWYAAGCPPADDSKLEFETAATVCHSFVIDGRMQFLSDCTHALAGQTVDIPAWPRPNWSDG